MAKKYDMEKLCRRNIEEFIFIIQEIHDGIVYGINSSKKYKRTFDIQNVHDYLRGLIDIDGDLIKFVHNNEDNWEFYSEKGEIFGGQVSLNIQMIKEFYNDTSAVNEPPYNNPPIEDECARYYRLRDKLECEYQTLSICKAINGNILCKLFLKEDFIKNLYEYCKLFIKRIKIDESFELYERDLIELYKNFDQIIENKELTSKQHSQIIPFMYTTRNCIMDLMCCIEQARHEYVIKKSAERILLKDRAYILYRLFKDVLLVDKSQDAIGDIISDLIGCEKTTMPKYMGDFNNPKEAPTQATKNVLRKSFNV